MSSHEFEIYNQVSQLIKSLSNNKSKSNNELKAQSYTDYLNKNITPFVTTQTSTHNAKRKIAQSSSSPELAEAFLKKCDELKSKNTKNLDSLIYILSKLVGTDVSSTKILERLKLDAEHKLSISNTKFNTHSDSQGASSDNAPSSNISPEEVEQLKESLIRESNFRSEKIQTSPIKKQPICNITLPTQPDWIYKRENFTQDFVNVSEGQIFDEKKVSKLSVQSQECIIISDLLFCMEGVEGKFIKPVPLSSHYGKRNFTFNPEFDPSLREMLKRILPICSYYSNVVRFIEEKAAFQYGLVNQALSASMRIIVKDYLVFVAQLEHQHRQGQLTLHRLWFYMQPSLRIMEILNSISNSINNGKCLGGSVLSLLHTKTNDLTGDTESQELCLFLTKSACVPYFDMLEQWIYKGTISDPYSEFLVKENETFNKEKLQKLYNDSYWEQHYTIYHDRIPLFLESLSEKILNTGKYLNVVRQCGRNVKCPSSDEIVYSLKTRKYFDLIEKAHDYASKLLLELLIEEKQLLARLKSIKHYFLIDQGDFIVQFMDMADDELKKHTDEILPTRLESLLELALRTSTADSDPFKDNLKVHLFSYDLITQLFKVMSIETKMEEEYSRKEITDSHLSGLEAFCFDYSVEWPLSLVLNRKSLTGYQMLFRHLFYCRHVERQICGVWLNDKLEKSSIENARWLTPAFTLRQRMLNFVHNFQYYMMVEVIEPNWHYFTQKMEAVTNIDEVLKHHNDFLGVCLTDCLLTSHDLLRIIHKMLMLCVSFSNYIQKLHKSTRLEPTEVDRPTGTARLQATQTDKSRREEIKSRKLSSKIQQHQINNDIGELFEQTVHTFDGNFTQLLLKLLDKITELGKSRSEQKLLNIFHRLDFNGFYTNTLKNTS